MRRLSKPQRNLAIIIGLVLLVDVFLGYRYYQDSELMPDLEADLRVERNHVTALRKGQDVAALNSELAKLESELAAEEQWLPRAGQNVEIYRLLTDAAARSNVQLLKIALSPQVAPGRLQTLRYEVMVRGEPRYIGYFVMGVEEGSPVDSYLDSFTLTAAPGGNSWDLTMNLLVLTIAGP